VRTGHEPQQGPQRAATHKGPGISPSRGSAVTPKQLEDVLENLALSQRGAGRLLKTNERQIRRWVAGDSQIPEAVAILLRMMIKHEINPEDV
jgi:DNA-binding transcriptional regulator YiaG